MTKIIRSASAGTLESNDVFVEIEPWDQGLQLTLESVVKQQFGDAIERSVRETLAQCGVERSASLVVDTTGFF